VHAERARTVEWVQHSREETTRQCRAELDAAEETARRIVASAEERVAELADLRGRIAAQLHGTQAQLGSALAALAPGSEPRPAVEPATAPRIVAPAATPPRIDPPEPPAAVTAPEPAPALPAPEPPPALPAALEDSPDDRRAATDDAAPDRASGPRESEPQQPATQQPEPQQPDPQQPATRPIPVSDPAPGTFVVDAPATDAVTRVPTQPTPTRKASTVPGPTAPEQAVPGEAPLHQTLPDQALPLDAEARRADSRRRRRRSATGATRR
jgi:hypothetical protein